MTLNEAVRALTAAGIDDAKNDAVTLFCAVSEKSRASVMFSMNDELEDTPYFERFMYFLSRRLSREPLQYILGKWSFYGDEYTVSPACLIPRADTEIIVDEVLANLVPKSKIADLCSGSGCIGIAVLRNSDAVCDSFDISEDALKLSEKNARDFGVSERIRFHKADMTKDSIGGVYDIIVSNPPYIKRHDMETLSPEVKKEPYIALDGGIDGMDFYRAIVKNYKGNLKDDGIFVFEIGYDEEAEICALSNENGFFCEVKRDYGGNPRAAVLRRK